MNWKRISITTLILWILGAIWGFLTCGWLFNWVYRIEPLIWKTPEQMFSAGAIIGSNVIGIISALIFVAVFHLLFKGLPGRGVKKGLHYGLIIWLVSAVAGMLSMPFYMTIAWTVVIYWVLNSLVWNLIAGAITAKLYKK